MSCFNGDDLIFEEAGASLSERVVFDEDWRYRLLLLLLQHTVSLVLKAFLAMLQRTQESKSKVGMQIGANLSDENHVQWCDRAFPVQVLVQGHNNFPYFISSLSPP